MMWFTGLFIEIRLRAGPVVAVAIDDIESCWILRSSFIWIVLSCRLKTMVLFFLI